MNCAWKELIQILPQRIRRDVDLIGKESLQEIRLRLDQEPELILTGRRTSLMGKTTVDELNFVINAASAYSPWSAATVAHGYLTAPGGHRIGLCGEAVVQDRVMTGIRKVRSLNIRVARDFPGISRQLERVNGSVLIIGCPSSGKTTLLRDLIRMRSTKENIAVVDERKELFPLGSGFDRNVRIDILSGCRKQEGIESVLRNMSPSVIAVDEITAGADCDALIQAGWCGVKLLATAHAASRQDLSGREIYKPLLCGCLFDTLVILSPDKTFRVERMKL